MIDPVRMMAERARHEPFFLGYLLERYAVAEQLDDQALATALGCSLDLLPEIRLCGAPRPDHFLDDIQQIAISFGLDAERWRVILKRATVLARLQESSNPQTGVNLLMAARERES